MPDEIKDLLSEWARWRYVDSISNVGYPTASAFARQMPPNPGDWGARSPLIDNETAERVDKAVSQLGMVCEEAERRGSQDRRFDVLTDHYLARRSDSNIARRIRADRRTVLTIRQNAENYVSGLLDAELWNR